MQVDASHGTFPHRMNLQRNSRHDNGLYAQPPPVQSQEKTTTETTIKKEIKDNAVEAESLEQLSASETTDNLEEELYDEQESIPYCVKTKPYYSINAKLNQREKPTVPANTSSNKYVEKGYSDSGIEESVPTSEDQTTPVEDIKPPPIWDANFKFLTSSATSRTAQTYNKSSVTCLICGKQLSNQYNLRVHMETHSNSSYSCTACSHVSRSRDALRKHVSYRHPVASPQKRPRYSTPKP
ncbi:hypothetical protein KM043_017307 [Ampulex compressa]|nr:hypothetical protein KM043_017307 [Ampulex compressa]